MSFKKSPISNRLLSLITLLCLFFSFYTEGVAQNTQTVIEGYVVAEKGDTIPFAHISAYRFPTDTNGQSLTSGFKNNVPYMEAGFGIGNIFKVFRVDVTRRLNYLDNPNTSKWRVQGEIIFDF